MGFEYFKYATSIDNLTVIFTTCKSHNTPSPGRIGQDIITIQSDDLHYNQFCGKFAINKTLNNLN